MYVMTVPINPILIEYMNSINTEDSILNNLYFSTYNKKYNRYNIYKIQFENYNFYRYSTNIYDPNIKYNKDLILYIRLSNISLYLINKNKYYRNYSYEDISHEAYIPYPAYTDIGILKAEEYPYYTRKTNYSIGYHLKQPKLINEYHNGMIKFILDYRKELSSITLSDNINDLNYNLNNFLYNNMEKNKSHFMRKYDNIFPIDKKGKYINKDIYNTYYA